MSDQRLSNSGTTIASENPVSAPGRPGNSIYCRTTFHKACDVEVFDGFSLIKLSMPQKGIYQSKGNPTQKLRHH